MMDRPTLEALRGLRAAAWKSFVGLLGDDARNREVVLAAMAAPTLSRDAARAAARYREHDERIQREELVWSEHLADSRRREAEGRALAEAKEGARP